MNTRGTCTAQPKVLVADDDRIILLTLAEGLAAEGFQVLCAQDGIAALEVCQSEKPDLALLDIRMPRLDGIELALRLKAETKVPFLFFSAFSDKNLVRQAVGAGALGYLLKPMDVKSIVPTLRAALARGREMQRQAMRLTQFDDAFASNRLIAMAVGITMRDKKLSQEEAFEDLRSTARHLRIKLVDLASSVVDGGLLSSRAH